MSRLFPLLLSSTLVTFTACSGKQVPDEPDEPKVRIQLTEAGLTPSPQPPVSKSSLEATFPGYTVAGEEGSKRLAIRDGGNTVVVVDVTDDGGYRAKAVDSAVAGPSGINVGAEWSTVAELSDIQCRRGTATWAEQVYCTSADLPQVAFVFEVPTDATPGCEEGCVLADNGVLAAYEVDSIEWQP